MCRHMSEHMSLRPRKIALNLFDAAGLLPVFGQFTPAFVEYSPAESFDRTAKGELPISRPVGHTVTLRSFKRIFIFIRLDTRVRPRK